MDLFFNVPELDETHIKSVEDYFDNYIFYRNVRKSRRFGYCSACGGLIKVHHTITDDLIGEPELWGARNGTTGLCPLCDAPVTYKPAGLYRSMRTLQRYQYVVFLLKGSDPNLVWARAYNACVTYYDDRRKKLALLEKATYRFTPGKCDVRWRSASVYFDQNRLAFWGDVFAGYTGDWISCKKPREPWQSTPYRDYPYYLVLGREILSDTFFRYSRFEKVFPNCEAQKALSFLSWYCTCPALEIAVRTGANAAIQRLLCDGVKNHLSLNWKANNPIDFYRTTKSVYKEMRRSVDDISEMLIAYPSAASSPKELRDALMIRRLLCGWNEALRFGAFAKRFCGSVSAAVGYLEKRLVFNWWFYRDYLDMAQELGFDLTVHNVLYPKDLKKAHDDVLKSYNAVKREIERRKTAELKRKRRKFLAKRGKMYEYLTDEYLIRLPLNAEEIVAEGRALHHCVGTYVGRHLEGSTTILFLRRVLEPDQPFFTVEMQDKRMVQCHGLLNIVPTEPSLKAFIDEWLEFVETGVRKEKAESAKIAEKGV